MGLKNAGTLDAILQRCPVSAGSQVGEQGGGVFRIFARTEGNAAGDDRDGFSGSRAERPSNGAISGCEVVMGFPEPEEGRRQTDEVCFPRQSHWQGGLDIMNIDKSI